jgi:hypothetical protein
MIAWREVTKAPFEYTESFSQSASGQTTYSESLDTVTGDILIIGTFTARYSTKTIQGSTSNETSSSSFLASYQTINEDGTSTSVESGSTYFLSISESGSFTEAAQFDDTAATTIGPSSNFTNTTTITAGSNPNATSGSNENASEGTTSTSVAMASSTPNTANPETSTTTTEEHYPTISTETTSSYSFVSTSSVSTTTISETDTITSSTWTTATSSSSANSIYTTETISTSTAEAVVSVNEEQTGNAFNTIYQAEAREVFYAATGAPLSGWNGIGQTISWATRTTLSHNSTNQPVYAIGTNLSQSSAANPSSSSSLSWSALTFSNITTTFAFLFPLPHSTTTVNSAVATTTMSTRSSSTAEQIVEYDGTSTSAVVSFLRSTTLQRYSGLLPYQITTATASTSTRISGIGAAGVTYESADESSGETFKLGGDTVVPDNSPRLGVHPPANPPSWSVYVPSGAAFGQSDIGNSYTFTGDFISEVSLVLARRGVLTIFPATNKTYTANRTGLTWKPNSTQQEETSSAAISAFGSSGLSFQNARTGLMGGALAPGEIAVQRAAAALYEDGEGETVWLGGNDTLNSGTGQTTSWLQPKYWLGAGGSAVRSAPRNSLQLPAIVPRSFV